MAILTAKLWDGRSIRSKIPGEISSNTFFTHREERQSHNTTTGVASNHVIFAFILVQVSYIAVQTIFKKGSFVIGP